MLELRWLVKQVKREVGQVQQPTLIVHPREDDRASLRNLEYLQTNLGSLIEAVVLDDSYHIVTLDRQRQLVVDRTLEFISQVGRSATSTYGEEDNLEWLLSSGAARPQWCNNKFPVAIWADQKSLTVFDPFAARQPTTKADRQRPAATLGPKKSAEKLRTRIGR
jgi:hypothetical protein